LEDPGVDGRIILRWIFRKWEGGAWIACILLHIHISNGRIRLKWIFKKWYGGAWTGLIWLRIGTGGRHL
jgi:hypothetical protein